MATLADYIKGLTDEYKMRSDNGQTAQANAVLAELNRVATETNGVWTAKATANPYQCAPAPNMTGIKFDATWISAARTAANNMAAGYSTSSSSVAPILQDVAATLLTNGSPDLATAASIVQQQLSADGFSNAAAVAAAISALSLSTVAPNGVAALQASAQWSQTAITPVSHPTFDEHSVTGG